MGGVRLLVWLRGHVGAGRVQRHERCGDVGVARSGKSLRVHWRQWLVEGGTEAGCWGLGVGNIGGRMLTRSWIDGGGFLRGKYESALLHHTTTIRAASQNVVFNPVTLNFTPLAVSTWFMIRREGSPRALAEGFICGVIPLLSVKCERVRRSQTPSPTLIFYFTNHAWPLLCRRPEVRRQCERCVDNIGVFVLGTRL